MSMYNALGVQNRELSINTNSKSQSLLSTHSLNNRRKKNIIEPSILAKQCDIARRFDSGVHRKLYFNHFSKVYEAKEKETILKNEYFHKHNQLFANMDVESTKHAERINQFMEQTLHMGTNRKSFSAPISPVTTQEIKSLENNNVANLYLEGINYSLESPEPSPNQSMLSSTSTSISNTISDKTPNRTLNTNPPPHKDFTMKLYETDEEIDDLLAKYSEFEKQRQQQHQQMNTDTSQEAYTVQTQFKDEPMPSADFRNHFLTDRGDELQFQQQPQQRPRSISNSLFDIASDDTDHKAINWFSGDLNYKVADPYEFASSSFEYQLLLSAKQLVYDWWSILVHISKLSKKMYQNGLQDPSWDEASVWLGKASYWIFFSSPGSILNLLGTTALNYFAKPLHLGTLVEDILIPEY